MVTARDLEPPPTPRPPVSDGVLIIVGLIFILFCVLFIRAIPSMFVTPSEASEQPTAAPLAAAGEAPVGAPVVEPTADSLAELATLINPPTPEPLAEVAALINPPAPEQPAGCPDAVVLPEGTRAVWRARASGCPGIIYAAVDGVSQWVVRPADFPQRLYDQLIELPVR